MDQKKVTEFTKENKGQLRQFTSIRNDIKELKKRVTELEKKEERFSIFRRGGFDVVVNMPEKEKAKIKIGGND